MEPHGIKTIYVVLHDAPKFGETPIIKMEINKQAYITHKQLIELRRKIENFLEQELDNMNHKVEYNGAWPT